MPIIETQETTELISPCRIVASERTEQTENILSNRYRQVSLGNFTYATIRAKGYVILDFGKEYSGGIRLLCSVNSPNGYVETRVRFGESVGECMAEPGEKNCGNHHSLRDFRVTVPFLSDIRFGSTAFRFVRIDNTDDYDLLILSAYATYTHCNAPQTGSFVCDDALVNRIYETAHHTVFLNMQNKMIWDGAKRDRLVWSGDLNTELLSVYYTHGFVENTRNSLTFCKETTPKGQWMNNIPSYSMWYIINLCDYYLYTGDREYILENKAYLEDTLRLLTGCIDENNQIDVMRGPTDENNIAAYFVDWPTCADREQSKIGVHALMMIALEKTLKLYASFGWNGEEWQTAYRRLSSFPLQKTTYKQIAAFKILAQGNKDADDVNVLINGGANGVSTFMAYYIFSALFKSGKGEDAMNMMKEYFGKMLQVGATAFFEDFDIAWAENCTKLNEIPRDDKKDIHGDFGKYCYEGYRHSLCHGWASGAIPFLCENILGVEIAEAGCKVLKIHPDLLGLKKATGDFPTPLGVVHIEHESVDGKIKTKTIAPAGIQVIVESR